MSTGATYTLDASTLVKLKQATPQQLDNWLGGVAEQMITEMKLSMGSSPPGITYKHGSVSHTASLPGYPPTPDTGALRASMHWEADGSSAHTFQLGDGVDYGIYLEFGTEHIEPRPFVGPVFGEWGAGGKLKADAAKAGLLDV